MGQSVIVSYSYAFSPNNTIYDFISYLNWKNSENKLINEWIYAIKDDSIVWDCSSYDVSIISSDFDSIGTINLVSEGRLIKKLTITMWDRDEILVRSSISQQTDNNHLGYTGTQYNQMKIYPMQTPLPTSFKIELYTTTNRPLELCPDGRDYVVMECCLRCL
jgi:hypothetical protein